MTLWVNILWF